MISNLLRRHLTKSYYSTAATFNQTSASAVESQSSLKWNDYFRLRIQRNRFRPLLGIPSLFLGAGMIASSIEYSPTEPILGMDPSIMMGLLAMGTGVLSYQVGTFASQTLWRLTKPRQQLRQFDSMDSRFYQSVKRNRAERGHNPYIQTLGRSSMRSASPDSMATDYYGERVKNLGEYRQWMRKQHKLVQQQSTDAKVLQKLSKN